MSKMRTPSNRSALTEVANALRAAVDAASRLSTDMKSKLP